jgi:hypothetical protein
MEDYVLLHIILLRIELLRGILIMEILQTKERKNFMENQKKY